MKQRVYEILYRELVEDYANSKGRTNTADFWLTISAMILCIRSSYIHNRSCYLHTFWIFYMLYPIGAAY